MLVLAIMMAVGYGANKARVMDDVTNERLSKLVLNISIPALIITSINGAGDSVTKGELGTIFLVMAAAYAILGVLALVVPKILRVGERDIGSYRYITWFGNIAFMGFPVVSAIFGASAAFYSAMFNIPFNILVYSVGVILISGKSKDVKFDFRMLLNAPIISAAAAIIMLLAGIKLPTPAEGALEMLGGVTTPAAMLLLGSSLAGIPVKELFTDFRIYLFAAAKLVLAPLIVWLILRQFLPAGSDLLGVTVVLSGMPVAINATMMAIEYGGNQALMSKAVFITTALSLVTIPLMAYFLSV